MSQFGSFGIENPLMPAGERRPTATLPDAASIVRLRYGRPIWMALMRRRTPVDSSLGPEAGKAIRDQRFVKIDMQGTSGAAKTMCHRSEKWWKQW